MRLRAATLTSVVVLAVLLGSCAAFQWGRDFPSPKPGAEIKNGMTTKAELQRMYGEPYQVGFQDGDQKWIWVYGKKGTGKDSDLSKQLDVTFNAQGVVKSHSFSSNFPEDLKVR